MPAVTGYPPYIPYGYTPADYAQPLPSNYAPPRYHYTPYPAVRFSSGDPYCNQYTPQTPYTPHNPYPYAHTQAAPAPPQGRSRYTPYNVSDMLRIVPTNEGPRLHYDFRTPPSDAEGYIDHELSDDEKMEAICMPPLHEIDVVSKSFPWTIKLRATSPVGVTLWDMVTQIHEELMKGVKDPEWWILSPEERAAISAQFEANCSSIADRDKRQGVCRIDWLKKDTKFKGFSKDHEFLAVRVPDKKKRVNTWVLTLQSS
ncbi:hypothetical protein BOTBODRAFT_143136 [Botryobasidium botryosum FD-172 SS1]|uniref:DUF6699 domain-containing protein n=1 Tax=Botryobasidium botryosum (strain FD-172 SS1) TaxID=930990 RepID=A0A067MT48_BOTB1|nr:hypothetical protein BOTBODRAFT_143136 [Botryobasidium botryosum FD-172 SS1]